MCLSRIMKYGHQIHMGPAGSVYPSKLRGIQRTCHECLVLIFLSGAPEQTRL